MMRIVPRVTTHNSAMKTINARVRVSTYGLRFAKEDDCKLTIAKCIPAGVQPSGCSSTLKRELQRGCNVNLQFLCDPADNRERCGVQLLSAAAVRRAGGAGARGRLTLTARVGHLQCGKITAITFPLLVPFRW